MGADGADATRAADVVAEEPAWSPDGKLLAYAGTPEAQSARGPLPVGICILDLGSGAVRRLKSGALGRSPDWSPDGKRIVFTRDFELRVLDVAVDAEVPFE
jgi:Tol biopolymer transport system component